MPGPVARLRRGAGAGPFPPLIDLLRLLYEREPLPFQTLNFQYGTEQRPHQDRMFFNSLPSDYMCGVWVALEDVDLDNGALLYYPQSHREPHLPYDALGLGRWNQSSRDAVDQDARRLRYEEMLEPLMAARGLAPATFTAPRGSTLVWAAGLVHGGSPIRDRARTRLSQVTHYFFEDCLYYTPIYSNEWLGDLYLRSFTDVRSGEIAPHSYDGLAVGGVAESDVYRIVLDVEDGREVARALRQQDLRTAARERTVAVLEEHVRNYQQILSGIERSPSFRLGRALTAPLRWLRRSGARDQ